MPLPMLFAAVNSTDDNSTWWKYGYTAFAQRPREWLAWEPFEHVESMHARFNKYLVAELQARLSEVEASEQSRAPTVSTSGSSPRRPHDADDRRHRAWNATALALTAGLGSAGVHVSLSYLPSMRGGRPTGPRFYASVDGAWAKTRGESVPPMPAALEAAMAFDGPADEDLWRDAVATGRWAPAVAASCAARRCTGHVMHNMGWTLVPPGSDAQDFHADWAHAVGMRHITWQREGTDHTCTTQFGDLAADLRGDGGAGREEVPLLVTDADAETGRLGAGQRAPIQGRTPKALVFDSGRSWHRGRGRSWHRGWASGLSIEISSAPGHALWEADWPALFADPVWRHMPILGREEGRGDDCDANDAWNDDAS